MIQRIGGGVLSSHVRIVAALTCAFGLNSALRAESEFEYGRALIERDTPESPTLDLVERLITKLEADKATAGDATLLRAALKRHQARNASIATRAALLADAEKLYAQVLGGPRTFRHYAIAEQDAAALDFDCVRALRKSATEDPAHAEKLLSDAAVVMAKVSQKYRAQADALYPEFVRCWNVFKIFVEQNDVENPKPVPASILDPLNRAFAAWLDPDQRSIAASVEQLDCLPEKDPARKTLTAELLKICEGRTGDEKLAEQSIALAWYAFVEGRVYAINLEADKAEEVWNAVNLDQQGLSVGQRTQLFSIQKLVLRERVKLFMALHHYSAVIEILSKIDLPPNLFSDDVGKEILSSYTRALTKADDADGFQFERAIRTLQAMIVREENTGSAWSAEFATAVAETVAGARAKHLPLKLRAAEWSSAGRGFMMKAEDAYRRYEELQRANAKDARAQYDAAAAEYDNTADCYQKAIAAARTETPVARMKIESKAWLSLSHCYLRTRNYLEAFVACKALMKDFGQKNRIWLPDLNKPANREAKEAIPELDTVVQQGALVLEYAKAQVIRHYPNQVIEELGTGADAEFAKGRDKLQSAIGIIDGAAKLQSGNDQAQEYSRAATALSEAAGQFERVKPGANYETALFQAGGAWMRIHELYATGKIAGRPEDLQAKAREFATKALAAFQKYEDATKAAASSESVTVERERRQGSLLLARASLCLGIGEWIGAVDATDAYMKWLRKNPANPEGADPALRNKFRALMELSAAKDTPEADAYAKDAADCMNVWRAMVTKNESVYQYMLSRLSRRYDALAADAAKQNFAADTMKSLYEKVADVEELRIASLKAGAPSSLAVKDLSYLFWTLHRANRDERAIQVGKELLDTFDSKGAGTSIPDDPKLWQAMLTKMIGDSASGQRGIIRYDDLTKWDRCKQDHLLLVDFMYDTITGAQYPSGDAHRPAFDRFSVDNDRALTQVQAIRKNYTDCATLRPELGEKGKSYLAIIEDEIEFRRKIAAARTLLLDLVSETRPDAPDAKERLELARDLLEVEIAKGNDGLNVKLKTAKIDFAIGKLDEALKLLYDIRAEAPSDSVIYFDASKLMSQIFARKGKWKDAMEFPEFIADIIGFDSQRVRERWPDMKQFLEECHKHDQK